MSCKITFKGKDYSPLNKCVIDLGPNYNLSLGREHYLRILIKFLDELFYYAKKQENNSLMLFKNKSEANKRFEKITKDDLYWIGANDEPYFGGLVGVATKNNLEITGKDLGAGEETEIYRFDVTLQITSRFDDDKPYFLSCMLSEGDPSLNPDTVNENNADPLFDFFLLFVYKRMLIDAYQKGYYRTYQRFEKNDDRLRGCIDVARHIKLNMGMGNGKIAYSYREKSVDNYLNHLIVAAYMQLKRKHYAMVMSNIDSNADTRGIIENLRMSINYPQYDVKTVIAKNLAVLSHPYYSEYEALRWVCLRILRDESVSIFNANDDEQIQGILFYIPDLWETYCEKLLRKISSVKYILQAQCKVMVFGDGKPIVYRQKTYPDFVFFKRNVLSDSNDETNLIPFMILDAKFKPAWGDVACGESSSFGNILEDYDKCIRDMNSINGHGCGVIFPTNKTEDKHWIFQHSISCYNTIDRFYTIPVFVPCTENSDTYLNWKSEFNKKLSKIFDEVIQPIINIEYSYSQGIKRQDDKLKSVENNINNILNPTRTP